ncbi:hypothetical protein GCM10011452_09080 [Gemmobacter lanyuensis]|uniref:Uncharacterized protein n=1 Tax=Gemmobacter lanyuensis TaxID=1054497 RepID=A0A918IQC1_9RHOB|nr:hypothetical protein GCM10011452_09080 [Gemmobacter lanyuensis]
MAADYNPASLLFGPYAPPDVKSGWVEDAIDGLIEVGGWTDAPIPWPRRKKTGRHSPILCGDLIRAVQTESSAAVQHHWGVSMGTVWRWRQALGVGRITDGTRKLLANVTGPPAEAAARGREAASAPAARAKMASTKRGRAAHPETAKALREAAKRPKPEGWGARANAWMRDGRQGKRGGDRAPEQPTDCD